VCFDNSSPELPFSILQISFQGRKSILSLQKQYEKYMRSITVPWSFLKAGHHNFEISKLYLSPDKELARSSSLGISSFSVVFPADFPLSRVGIMPFSLLLLPQRSGEMP